MKVYNTYSYWHVRQENCKKPEVASSNNQDTNGSVNIYIGNHSTKAFCGFFNIFKKKKPDYDIGNQDAFRKLVEDYQESRKPYISDKVVTFEDFNNWINGFAKYLDTDLDSAINILVKYSTDDENIKGSGAEHIVYFIPRCQEYVLRVSKSVIPVPGEMTEIYDEFPELNLGQPVAKLGKGFEILKKQTGIPCGVPGQFRNSPCGADFYLNHLMNAAKMPQSAYDDLARTLKILFEHNKTFDAANPNNILIDEDNGKFNLIDDLYPLDKFAAYAGRTPLEHMLSALIDFCDADRFYRDEFFILKKNGYNLNKQEVNDYCSVILDKCIESAKKTGLPVPEEMSKMTDAFELAGKTQNDWQKARNNWLSGNE